MRRGCAPADRPGAAEETRHRLGLRQGKENVMGEHRESGIAMRRGLLGRCPKCGEGAMFDGYLTLSPRCGACGEPLGEYRAADGPAFFTICIVGLLLIPILGFGFVVFRPEPLTLLLVVSLIVALLTLVILRLVKGAFVGYLWSQHERDPGS
jgi:uncharacterized protein (DUF983 family)